jgi:two-component system OmpR family response regulator
LRAGCDNDLHYRELLLLEQFVWWAGPVVTLSMLLEAAWDDDFVPRGNIVDMHIHRLRRKIDRRFERHLSTPSQVPVTKRHCKSDFMIRRSGSYCR